MGTDRVPAWPLVSSHVTSRITSLQAIPRGNRHHGRVGPPPTEPKVRGSNPLGRVTRLGRWWAFPGASLPALGTRVRGSEARERFWPSLWRVFGEFGGGSGGARPSRRRASRPPNVRQSTGRPMGRPQTLGSPATRGNHRAAVLGLFVAPGPSSATGFRRFSPRVQYENRTARTAPGGQATSPRIASTAPTALSALLSVHRRR